MPSARAIINICHFTHPNTTAIMFREHLAKNLQIREIQGSYLISLSRESCLLKCLQPSKSRYCHKASAAQFCGKVSETSKTGLNSSESIEAQYVLVQFAQVRIDFR